MRFSALLFTFTLCSLAGTASAYEVCDLGGRAISSDRDLAGQTGRVICKDNVTNLPIKHFDVQSGVRKGYVAEFSGGVLVREFHVDEKAALHGILKEFAPGADNKPILQKEITYRAGAPVGVSKLFYPRGTLKRLGYNTDGARELAFAEFTANGKLYELSCTTQPVFSPLIDDVTWCGHRGSAVIVTFYGEDDFPASKNVFENGVRKLRTLLWKNGLPRTEEGFTEKGGIDRVFFENGKLKQETEWEAQGAKKDRIRVMERKFNEQGVLISDQRWRTVERGSIPTSVKTWYPDGAKMMESDFVSRGSPPELVRLEVMYHENGKVSGKGMWGTNGRRDTTPRDIQSRYNEQGILIVENHFNARGEPVREREFNDSGRLIMDVEITPDGQRISLMGATGNLLPRNLKGSP